MLVISLSISHQIIKKHKIITNKLFKTKLFLYLEILSFLILIIIFFNISGSLLNNYLNLRTYIFFLHLSVTLIYLIYYQCRRDRMVIGFTTT